LTFELTEGVGLAAAIDVAAAGAITANATVSSFVRLFIDAPWGNVGLADWRGTDQPVAELRVNADRAPARIGWSCGGCALQRDRAETTGRKTI
jgi:hypothetical protein